MRETNTSWERLAFCEQADRASSFVSFAHKFGDWNHVLQATEASAVDNESRNAIAGPSTYYALHQNTVFEHLPQLRVACNVCGESLHPHLTVRLVCSDSKPFILVTLLGVPLTGIYRIYSWKDKIAEIAIA